jgi:hypothetical protein
MLSQLFITIAREIEGIINSDFDAETRGLPIKNIQIDQCSSIGQCFLNTTLALL